MYHYPKSYLTLFCGHVNNATKNNGKLFSISYFDTSFVVAEEMLLVTLVSRQSENMPTIDHPILSLDVNIENGTIALLWRQHQLTGIKEL